MYTLLEASIARFYGWTLEEIYKTGFYDVMRMYKAIDILLTNEHQTMLDIISFPHMKRQTKQKILNHYTGHQQAAADVKTMALRYSAHTKKIGQKWPGEKKDG